MHMHMRFLTVSALTAGLCAGTGDVRAQGSVAFSRVVTQPNVFVDNVAAVADLDGDGRDDVIAFKSLEYNVAREDRLTKSPLRLFVSVGDGSFRHAPELVEGTIDVRFPIVVADDFNGDGRADLAVFDGGVYVVAESVGVGNPPQLFLSSPDGRLRSSSALADAVRREHALRRTQTTLGPPTSISNRRLQATSMATVTSTCGSTASAAPTSPATSW